MESLASQHCKACEGNTPALAPNEISQYLNTLLHWATNEHYTEIARTFHFKNYWQTMAFVNFVAWIAHRENHHPKMLVNFNTCEVCYSTHAVSGLTQNDFISAAKINQWVDDQA